MDRSWWAALVSHLRRLSDEDQPERAVEGLGGSALSDDFGAGASQGGGASEMSQVLTRRNFLTGLIAAPAIVHAGNLMPIKKLAWSPTDPATNPYWVLKGVTSEWTIKSSCVEINEVDPLVMQLLCEQQREREKKMVAYLNDCIYGDHECSPGGLSSRVS